MKKRMIRPVSLLLVFLMTAGMLLSCAGGKKPKKTGKEAETEPKAESRIHSRNTLPSLDFRGENFTILARYHLDMQDVEELTGDGINDAVYNRNRKVEDDLNIKISVENFSQDGDELREAILANDQRYNAVLDDMPTMSQYMKEGLFYDTELISYLDLDKPYWSQGVSESLAVCNKVYQFAGDMSIYNNMNIWCIYFNKEIAENLQLGDLYAVRDSGNWTFDTFLDMASKGAMDLDGNGRFTYRIDQYATINMQESYSSLFNSMGQRIIERDDEGNLIFVGDSEGAVSTYQRISEYARTGYGRQFLTVDMIKDENKWAIQTEVFTSGRGLFFHGQADDVLGEEFRGMEQEYGMMPMPKADEKQRNYISSTQEWGYCVFGIPVCSADPDLSGAALEMLCDYSTDTVRYACYDQALYRKYTRDVDATVTLDILFDNIIIDPGFVFIKIGDEKLRNVIRSGIMNNKVASTLEANKRLIIKAIEDLEDSVDRLDH